MLIKPTNEDLRFAKVAHGPRAIRETSAMEASQPTSLPRSPAPRSRSPRGGHSSCPASTGSAPVTAFIRPTRTQRPKFDFDQYTYVVQVRRHMKCPCYSAPYPHGTHLGFTYHAGDSVEVAGDAHVAKEYVAVRTEQGWVNVLHLYNKAGRPTGVAFCDISRRSRRHCLYWP